jgi:hypothetical protein
MKRVMSEDEGGGDAAPMNGADDDTMADCPA